MFRIAVIGEGIIGLSTAIRIQELIKTCRVDIYTEKLSMNSTSYVAAGIFRVNTIHLPGTAKNLLRDWCRDSWAHFDLLVHSDQASDAGVSVIAINHIYDEHTEVDHFYKNFVYSFRVLSKDEVLRRYKQKDKCKGVTFSTVLVEPRFYLQWLEKRYFENGGKIIQKKITNICSLSEYDVVVNCTGLGSRDLINDAELVSLKGCHLRVKAPWIKQGLFCDKTWIIPCRNDVVVGGSHIFNNYDEQINLEESGEIFERACNIMPNLRRATIVERVVGLRPWRESIRVETEEIKNPDNGKRSIKVVHNYGHGGHGVALSWGCATHAANLVSSLLGLHSKL